MVSEPFSSFVREHEIYKSQRDSRGGYEDHTLSIPDQAKHRLFDEIDEIFDTMDSKKDGIISKEEFQQNLKLIRFFVPKHQVDQMFERLDMDKSGTIKREEFYRYAITQQEHILALWNKLQNLNDNHIRVSEIKSYFVGLGHNVTDAQIENFVTFVNQHYQSSNRDSIEFEYFRDWLFLSPIPLNTQFDFYIASQFWRTPSDIRDWKSGPIVFLAGALAGVASRTTTAPADRLKVFYQAGGQSGVSIRQLAARIYQEGGVRGFWRGNGANVVKVAPENATRFFMYEHLKSIICVTPDKPSISERFMCGAGAGAVAQFSIYPLEITKTRLALAQTGELNGIASTMRMIWRNEGFAGIFRGCGASVIGIIPYAGTDLMVYNTLRHKYIERTEHEPSSWITLSTGAFASICGQLIAYPFQLVRTRLQSYGRNPEEWGMGQQKPSITSVVRYILRKRGFFGLYAGITCNFMKSVPSISISYVVYEKSRSWLKQSIYSQ